MKFPKFSKYEWLLVVLIFLYCCKVTIQGAGDLTVYYGAAKLLRAGQGIYCVDIPVSDGFCGYSYSPFFAFLFYYLFVLSTFSSIFCSLFYFSNYFLYQLFL